LRQRSLITLRPTSTINPSTSYILIYAGRRPGIECVSFSCSKLRGMEDKIPFILQQHHTEDYIVTTFHLHCAPPPPLGRERLKHFAINSHNTLPLRKGKCWNCSITSKFSFFFFFTEGITLQYKNDYRPAPRMYNIPYTLFPFLVTVLFTRSNKYQI